MRIPGIFTLSLVIAFPQLASAEKSSDKMQALLAQMTLEEKVGQLNFARISTDNIDELVKAGRVGGLLNVRDHEGRARLEKVASQESRLKIPLLHCADVIHGYRTIFPIPLAMAAAWNESQVEEASEIAAREAASVANVRLTFSPMVDVTRDPRWGRIAEGFGEDVLLTERMGAAMVRGYQGKTLDGPASVAACPKHFAAYGASEGGRDYNTADVSEQRLRNYYLPPFLACFKAGALAVMPAFTSLNGEPISASADMLRTILREEWKYDGITISDAKAIEQLIQHGFARDISDAAVKALLGGMDVEIISACYNDTLAQAVKDGKVPEKLLDEAVLRVLRLKEALGLFDSPAGRLEPAVLQPASLELARDMTRRSIVLLKNDGVLPLAGKVSSVAVIGPQADNPIEQLGTWAVYAKKEDSVTPLKALRAKLGEEAVRYAAGLKNATDTTTTQIAKAVEAAKSADLVILFVGEDGKQTGEAKSRSSLALSGVQPALIEAIAATGKPIITVLQGGRPLEIGDLLSKSSALLMAWHGGTMAGPAIVDVLFGDYNPSGRLPVTWPRVTGQVPIHYDHENTGRPARDPNVPAMNENQIDTKHVTGYIDSPGAPQFPFGFGLSYTSFEYSNLKVASPNVRAGETLKVSVTIRNTGKVAGEEIAQLYTRQPVASLTRPIRQLRDYQAVKLAAGESRTVEFELPVDSLAFYKKGPKPVLEPGPFTVWIAPDATSGHPVEFSVLP